MAVIRQQDFIQSIADAFQYISYYHSEDFIRAMVQAYANEQSQAAKGAIEQILINSQLCALGHRPICQDTGICVVFLKVGMQVRWECTMSVQEMVDEGVRQAYQCNENPLRASILRDPAGSRTNTRDNTPAIVHYELVPGDQVEVICAAKGGGSENKAKLAMLNPAASITEWVVKTVPTLGAGWCPPGVLGIGIGGTPEKAMLMAKESLMLPVDIYKLQLKAANQESLTTLEKIRLDIYQQVNALGIGAQGLGGLVTVLDVKIISYPTHAASLPVAIIPNCAATRHIRFTLTGSGPISLFPPDLDIWPELSGHNIAGQRVNLNTITREEVADWKSGDTLLLNGKILTGRDAAHRRLTDLLNKNVPLPIDLNNRFIYYVGPVDAVGNEAVGPAGPTTATRMDSFTPQLLSRTGLLGMIGKAERGDQAIDAIKMNRAVYLITVGGAAYLVSKTIRSARVLAFPELGMEAMYEFDVKDMPVTVAVDSQGISLHKKGPAQWSHPVSFQISKV